MNRLRDMPNIGEVVERELVAVGITTPQELVAAGSREAFTRIKLQVDPGACLSKLCGLEGAVQNIRWHHLPDKTKAELKAFHASFD